MCNNKFLFILFFVFIYISLNDGQTLIRYEPTKLSYALQYSNERQRYECPLIIYVFLSHNVQILAKDFGQTDDHKVSPICTSNLTNQIFQINTTIPIGDPQVIIQMTSGQLPPIGPFTCKDPQYIEGITLNKTYSQYYNPLTSTVRMGFTINTKPTDPIAPLACNGTQLVCFVYPLGTANNNEYYLELIKITWFIYINFNTINITIGNSLNTTDPISFQIPSIFPHTPTEFTKVDIYPRANSSISMNPLYQDDTATLLLTVKSKLTSSLYFANRNFQFINNYKVVKSNQDGIVLMSVSKLLPGLNNFQLYEIVDQERLLANTANINYFINQLNTSYSNISVKITYEGVTARSLASHQIDFERLTNGHLVTPLLDIPFEYPYGLSKTGYTFTWKSDYSLPTAVYGDYTVGYSIGSSIILENNYSIPFNGVGPDVRLNSISLSKISSTSLIVSINITSRNPILKLDYCGLPIGGKELVNITPEYSLYQRLVTYSIDRTFSTSQYLSVYDTTTVANPLVTFVEGQLYNDNNQYFPTILDYYFSHVSIKDITLFKFFSYNVDISGGANLRNYLTFNLTRYGDFIPMLVIGDRDLIDRNYQNKNLTFYGSYNSNLKAYMIQFNIPSQFTTGELEYYLVTPFQVFNSSTLSTVFGPDAILNIINTKGDMMVPIITEIVAVPQGNYTITQNTVVTWTLKIKDEPNGFNYGIISIMSNIDFEPRVFTIRSVNRVSGDEFEGTYLIEFPLNYDTCRTETFFISKVELYDMGNVVLNTNIMSSLSTIDGNYTQSVVNIICPNDQSFNTEGPTTVQMLLPSETIDVGSRSRTFNVSFTLSAITYNTLSIRHDPILYLNSIPYSLQVRAQRLSSVDNLSNYTAQVTLPYGFGTSVIFVSLSGLVDNRLNMKSLTSVDLKKITNNYSINRNFTLNADPTLENYTPFSPEGGQIVISGYSLGMEMSSIGEIDYGSGFTDISIAQRWGVAIVLYLPTFKNINSAKFRVNFNGLYTNEIILIPTLASYVPPIITPSPTTTIHTPFPSITPSPSNTPGCNPQCSSNGKCVNQQCICNGKWVGPTCSSELVLIPAPPPDVNKPTTQTTVPNNNKINITMSVVQINEVNTEGEIISQYDLRSGINWKFTDMSIDNQTFYHYTTQLPGSNTVINTTLQFFEKETVIVFAGKNYTMTASSIKFTSSLSQYNFKSNLNLLDLVFESKISTVDGDSCSSKMNGSNSDGQWIKININDYSLYGTFINVVSLDDREYSVKNIIIDENTYKKSSNTNSTSQQSTNQNRLLQVAVRIPAYESTVIVDPNFSVMLDLEDEGSSRLCSKNDSKFKTAVIVGIVVGSVAFIAIVVALIIVYKRRLKIFYKIKMERYRK